MSDNIVYLYHWIENPSFIPLFLYSVSFWAQTWPLITTVELLFLDYSVVLVNVYLSAGTGVSGFTWLVRHFNDHSVRVSGVFDPPSIDLKHTGNLHHILSPALTPRPTACRWWGNPSGVEGESWLVKQVLLLCSFPLSSLFLLFVSFRQLHTSMRSSKKRWCEYFLSKEEIRDNLLKFSLSGWVFLFYKSVNV